MERDQASKFINDLLKLMISRNGSDLFITGDGRYHSGLEINQGIATAGVVSAGATLGLSHTAGSFSLQPYFRAQAGSLRPRTSGTASSTSFVGGSAGLVIVTRF